MAAVNGQDPTIQLAVNGAFRSNGRFRSNGLYGASSSANGHVTNGNGVVTNGNGAPVNGNGAPVNGNGGLVNGNGALAAPSVNGNGVHAGPNGYYVSASAPTNGNGGMINGNGAIINGNGAIVNGNGGVLPQVIPEDVPTEIIEGQSIPEIPGVAGIDYPIFSVAPPTLFNCQEQQWPGYYADVESRCQVCKRHRLIFIFFCKTKTTMFS